MLRSEWRRACALTARATRTSSSVTATTTGTHFLSDCRSAMSRSDGTPNWPHSTALHSRGGPPYSKRPNRCPEATSRPQLAPSVEARTLTVEAMSPFRTRSTAKWCRTGGPAGTATPPGGGGGSGSLAIKVPMNPPSAVANWSSAEDTALHEQALAGPAGTTVSAPTATTRARSVHKEERRCRPACPARAPPPGAGPTPLRTPAPLGPTGSTAGGRSRLSSGPSACSSPGGDRSRRRSSKAQAFSASATSKPPFRLHLHVPIWPRTTGLSFHAISSARTLWPRH